MRVYTIGQVAKFLGLSRDTLKFYEEKGLVKPVQDKENGYRRYSLFDIDDVLTVNFYREIDVEIKQIQKLKNDGNLEEIESLLDKQEKKIQEEIEYKRMLLNNIKTVKDNYKTIKENLWKYSIKEMKPVEVKGEFQLENMLEQYDLLKEGEKKLKKATTLKTLTRVINFDDKGIIGHKYIVVKKINEDDKETEREIISYPKCIYTVIDDKLKENGEDLDKKMEKEFRNIAMKMGYKLLGVVYINMLISTYENGGNYFYLEIYAPVK